MVVADGVQRSALVLGIEGPRPGLGEAEAVGLPPLTQAPGLAKELAQALAGYGYAVSADKSEPATATELASFVDEAVVRPGLVVVHVATHGQPGPQASTLYVRGADGQICTLSVNEWLNRAELREDGAVLFVLDICHAGAAVDAQLLHWAERRRAWVLAAAGAADPAYDCRLTQAVTQVLEEFRSGQLQVDGGVPHIPERRFFNEVHLALRQLSRGRHPQELHSTAVPMHLEDPARGFLPNPQRTHDADADLRHRVDPALATLVDEGLDARHFMSRAAASETLFQGLGRGFFHGRRPQLQTLRAWALGQGPALRVVTGKPGVGKSALLGVFVTAAHPVLRDHTGQLWGGLPSEAKPPRMRDGGLAVVHARRRSVAAVCASLAQQWQLAPRARQDWTGQDLVDALRSRLDAAEDGDTSGPAEGPVFAVVDAVDEADRPTDLIHTVLLPLADATDAARSPLCRLLVGVRPELASLLARAGDGLSGGLVDLAQVPRGELRPALREYVVDVLGAGTPYDDVDHAPGAAALAESMAQALAGDGDENTPASSEWGEFLVAALYLRHLLNQPPVRDADAARQLGANVPRDLRGVLALDLDRRQDPWLLPVATALAFAEGNGMPETVIRHATAGVLDATGRAPAVPGQPPLPDTPTVDQVRSALRRLRFYLRQDVDVDASTLYRLFHQGLADQLRAEARDADGEVDGRIWRRLLHGVLGWRGVGVLA